jgi:hypothetical protein
MKQIVVIIESYHLSYQVHKKFYPTIRRYTKKIARGPLVWILDEADQWPHSAFVNIGGGMEQYWVFIGKPVI